VPPAVSEDDAPNAIPIILHENNDADILAEPEPFVLSGEMAITLDFVRQSGSASNQYAVWIEDSDGNLITSLYASQWTARGGYMTRPDSIALWVAKSDLASMTESEVDAVSGATPQTGAQTYTWDLTNTDGNVVLPGEYRFFVEGTLRWRNYVLFSGEIMLGDSPVVVKADAEFIYEAAGRYGALTGNSPENAMIGSVQASYVPAATG
jgi:hypothetical protein